MGPCVALSRVHRGHLHDLPESTGQGLPAVALMEHAVRGTYPLAFASSLGDSNGHPRLRTATLKKYGAAADSLSRCLICTPK